MKQLIILSAIAMMLCGCKKEAALPAPTTTGAQTFGCRINGQTFSSAGTPQSGRPGGIGSYYYRIPWRQVTIIAEQGDPRYQVSLSFNFQDTTGRYELSRYPYSGEFTDISGVSTVINGSNEYRTNMIRKGYVEVTNYSGNVLSGTFEFDAVNDSNEVVQIRDGRFDVILNW